MREPAKPSPAKPSPAKPSQDKSSPARPAPEQPSTAKPAPAKAPSAKSSARRRLAPPSRRELAHRLAGAVGLWAALTLGGLVIGIAGYAYFEGQGLVDAFLNAAMILSGMGPAAELKTEGGKIFAGLYAVFSGLIIVIATGFVLAPIFHHVLHRFHFERDGED